MARGLDFGVVWINAHIPFASEMPHGGFKNSGYGKEPVLRCRIRVVRGSCGACDADGACGERSAWWMLDRYSPAHT
jgi:hypothetical protein